MIADGGKMDNVRGEVGQVRESKTLSTFSVHHLLRSDVEKRMLIGFVSRSSAMQL
jgi:hypothetical protein